MHPMKVLDPNGYHAKFFQCYWNKVGHKIVQLLLGFLNDRISFSKLNHTFITLILKMKYFDLIVAFRSISLCNVTYKLLSKVLVNQIKPILANVVKDAPSVFISN